MTRKDYELIAKSINAIASEYVEQAKDRNDSSIRDAIFHFSTLATSISIDLAKDNPRFSQEKFLWACGVDNSGLAYLLRGESRA